MPKYKILIPKNGEIITALQEASNILIGLSESVNKFDSEGGGYNNRMNKKYWKGKADEWKAKYMVNGV